MSLTAVSIGSFDAVHAGHEKLVKLARQEVGPAGRVVVLAFDPHPLSCLRPASAPPRLSTFSQRARWLTQAGADEVVRLDPAPDFLAMSPRQFLHQILAAYHPGVFVEGADFHFGKDRAGNVDLLAQLGPQLGFRTVIADTVQCCLSDHALVRASSSITRWLIARGRVRDAALVIGRPYELSCIVQQGDQRGRTLGYPTANLSHEDYLLPLDGVYAGQALLDDGRAFPAAISVGTKPTFGDNRRVCEAHLLDFDGPIGHYGWTISLRFHDFLRDQLCYPSLDALIQQLRRDVLHVRAAALQKACA